MATIRQIVEHSAPNARKKLWEAFVGAILASVTQNWTQAGLVFFGLLLCISVGEFFRSRGELEKPPKTRKKSAASNRAFYLWLTVKVVFVVAATAFLGVKMRQQIKSKEGVTIAVRILNNRTNELKIQRIGFLEFRESIGNTVDFFNERPAALITPDGKFSIGPTYVSSTSTMPFSGASPSTAAMCWRI